MHCLRRKVFTSRRLDPSGRVRAERFAGLIKEGARNAGPGFHQKSLWKELFAALATSCRTKAQQTHG